VSAGTAFRKRKKYGGEVALCRPSENGPKVTAKAEIA
jgi:hypothetical protein